MKKHILVVASTFPSSDNDPVPAFVKDQIIAMKHEEPKLRFSVLAPHDKRSNTKHFVRHKAYDEYRFHYAWPHSAEKLAGRGIMPALKANPLNYLLIPFLFGGEFFALLRLTRKLKPDIIYAHWFTPQAIIARAVSRMTNTKFVFTTHASDVDVWRKIPLIGTNVVTGTVPKSAAFTAVSRRSMQKLRRFFTSAQWKKIENRSAIIPMGVSLPKQEKNTVSVTPGSLLFLGRLAEKKGVHYLLPAYKALLKTHPKATLTIAGDGPWLQKLKDQAAALGLDTVIFTGFVSGKTKAATILACEVYVVPSIIASDGDAEGLPVSLMEGLAYGRTCIATNESGADDIITDGKDGFLVEEKNVDQLTAALKNALSLSAAKRKKMSENARETASQFSWPIVARKHIDFLLKD